MNELQQVLNNIKQDKDTNLLPANLKDGVKVLGIEGTLENKVKLFETVEEMQADPDAKEGDLAVVYREEIQNMTADTQTQYITFPETVTLPEAFTDSFRGMLRPVDTSSMFDSQIQLRKTRFSFDGYFESGEISVQYNSIDGITYTRTRFSGGSGDLTNLVDLGTIVKYESMESWNDALGYFMLVGGMRFDGLYEYGDYLLEGTYCNSYGVNTELNDIPYLSPNISRPDEVGYDYNIIVVTDSHLDASGLYKVIDKCKVLWYGGGYGRDAVYNGKQGILVTLYEPSYAESSSTNLNSVLEEYDFTTSTNPTSKQIIHNWDDVSIFPSPIYVAQSRSSSIEPYNRKWYFTSYENADYTGNGHAASYKHNIYSVPSDITLPISSTGYGTPEGITSKYGADYYANIYTNRYKLAQNQYNLTSSNQLYPNISAYGKSGNVTGDDSLFDWSNIPVDLTKNYFGVTDWEDCLDINTPKNTIPVTIFKNVNAEIGSNLSDTYLTKEDYDMLKDKYPDANLSDISIYDIRIYLVNVTKDPSYTIPNNENLPYCYYLDDRSMDYTYIMFTDRFMENKVFVKMPYCVDYRMLRGNNQFICFSNTELTIIDIDGTVHTLDGFSIGGTSRMTNAMFSENMQYLYFGVTQRNMDC